MSHRMLIIRFGCPPVDLTLQLRRCDRALAARLAANVPAVRSTQDEVREVVSLFSRFLPA